MYCTVYNSSITIYDVCCYPYTKLHCKTPGDAYCKHLSKRNSEHVTVKATVFYIKYYSPAAMSYSTVA